MDGMRSNMMASSLPESPCQISFYESSGHGFSHAGKARLQRASAPEVGPSVAKAARKGNVATLDMARLKSCPDGRRKSFAGFLALIPALALALSVACSRSSAPEYGSGTGAAGRSGPVSMNKDDYPVFPDADAGADPSVPAEQGGKGFTGEGWETNTDFDLIGDPHALKGGVLRDTLLDFPGTLRISGPEWNTQFNYAVSPMIYETLLGLHPSTQEYVPGLATHWQISPDKMTYRFRINPNARFSDGTPVTSEDVVATYDFMMDKGLQDPSNQITYGKLERPIAEGKYIVRVRAKELNWRNFLYFSQSMVILPAHVLKTINGDKYLKEYNYKLLPGSGPYLIREEDIVKGKSITVRRRSGYWAEKARANVGLGNFDELRFTVVRDDNLAFEMFKKGELDYYYVPTARRWVEELNFENVQRGLVQKRKIFNDDPQGVRGFAMNTRRPPFDDIRVRKAFALLTNRQQMIEKLSYNEDLPLNSYFPGGIYENPNNPKISYDPGAALKLLAEAGWKERDSRGRLVKNGQPLEVEMLYTLKLLEPYLTVFQEDVRRVGITVNLRQLTPETQFQMINERRFQMTWIAWGGLLFPNPETQLHSSLADQENNNNVTGFKNKRVDELCALYDKTFDPAERIRLIREIDGIVTNDYQYVLLWYRPYQRIVYWNKFGTPPGYLTRVGDFFNVLSLWWIDPEKDQELKQAMGDPSVKLEVGPTDDRYWIEYGKRQQAQE
jgi:microcin C transport system substrate-binding protein